MKTLVSLAADREAIIKHSIRTDYNKEQIDAYNEMQNQRAEYEHRRGTEDPPYPSDDIDIVGAIKYNCCAEIVGIVIFNTAPLNITCIETFITISEWDWKAISSAVSDIHAQAATTTKTLHEVWKEYMEF